MITYTTLNSEYIVDEEGMRYMRLARDDEHMRPDPSHRLTYGEWHPLKSLPVIIDDPYGSPFQAPELREQVLHILREDSTVGIFTSVLVDVGNY